MKSFLQLYVWPLVFITAVFAALTLLSMAAGCEKEYAPPPEAAMGWLMPDGRHFDKTTGKTCEVSQCHHRPTTVDAPKHF